MGLAVILCLKFYLTLFMLSSVNYGKDHLYAQVFVLVFDSESCPRLRMWHFGKLNYLCSFHNKCIMITRKLTVCFFAENHSAPPDVTTYTSEHAIQVERPQGSTTSRTAPKYGNAELMETGDGTSSSKFPPL